MNRRTLIKAGAGLVAAGAVGGGVWVQSQRTRRQSDPITGPWPELGQHSFWLLPNLVDARMVVPDRPHAKQESIEGNFGRARSFLVNTNSQRLRNAELGPKAGSRVLCIGDSVTFGWGVADDESYPAQLAAQMGIEVLNAGVPAQNTFTMRRYIELKAQELQIDAVCWTRRPQLNLPDPIGDYARELGMARRAAKDAAFIVVLPPISRFDPKGVESWAEEERQLTNRLDVPVVELTRPFFAAQQGGATVAIDGDQLTLMDGDRVVVQDTRPQFDLPRSFYDAFEDDPSLKEHLFFDSGHPDAEGFTLFAAQVALALKPLL